MTAADRAATAMPGHASRSLMGRAVLGFGWIFAWRIASRILGVGSTLLLVRLLVPADFGLIELSSSFLLAIESFSALGVEEAVVRASEQDDALYDTAFTMIAARSTLLTILIAATAAPMAEFFGDPRLRPIVLVFAGTTFLSGLANIRVLEFRRDLRFDREFQLQLVPRVAGVIVTIAAALIWRDYWALVAGTAVQRLLRVPYSYLMRPYLPCLTLKAWRLLIGFSLWTWMLCIVRLARDRINVFVLGREIGTSSVGTFSVALEIATLPTTELLLPMGRALFSAVSEMHRAGRSSETMWLRVVGLIALLGFPASIGLALVAAPLVRVMLGPQWMIAVPLLQIAAVAGAFSIFEHCCHIQLDAAGLVHVDFQAVCITTTIRVTLALLLVPKFGLIGAVAGGAIATLLDQAVYLTFKKLVVTLQIPLLLRQIWRPALATAGMAGCVIWTGFARLPAHADESSAAGHLVAAALVGAVLYVVILISAWQAAGRPAGTEADILLQLRQAFARFLGSIPVTR